jgi:hypothetical protein
MTTHDVIEMKEHRFKIKVAPQNKKAHFGTVRFRGI